MTAKFRKLLCRIGLHDYKIGIDWCRARRCDVCQDCGKRRWVDDMKNFKKLILKQ